MSRYLLQAYTANGRGTALLLASMLQILEEAGTPKPSLRKGILLFCFKHVTGFPLSTYTEYKSHCLLNSLVLCRIVCVKFCSLPMSLSTPCPPGSPLSIIHTPAQSRSSSVSMPDTSRRLAVIPHWTVSTAHSSYPLHCMAHSLTLCRNQVSICFSYWPLALTLHQASWIRHTCLQH